MSSANAALVRSASVVAIVPSRSMSYFPAAGGGVVAGALAGIGVVPGVVGAGAEPGLSGATSVTLQSIAARFSIGGAAPPVSKPRQSTREILPSVAVNELVLRAVNVNFERYSNTP